MFTINYTKCYQNNCRYDVEKALKIYLNEVAQENEFVGFVLYPPALNPFLKIMETLGESRNVIILPVFNNDGEEPNKPAYLILRRNAIYNYIEGISFVSEGYIPSVEAVTETIVNAIKSR
jgi:hypothetical protein